jgi:pimeloyl-ACP methyl ester carboxylesterase
MPVPDKLSNLDSFLADRESAYDLKAGTEAHIEWQPRRKYKQTEYALVYLHGFRASHPEGHPVHRNIARFLGANLYLSRLQEHGLHADYPLQNLTEEKLLASARFALSIGQKIGQKVVLMGTSTGGSLALYLAAQPANRSKISGLILYSPLIQFYGVKEKLLQHGLPRTVAKLLTRRSCLVKKPPVTDAEHAIWNSAYALRGVLALGQFVDHHMKDELFQNVNCPVFTGFYYKNKRQQDKVVSIKAIRNMISNIGTSSAKVLFSNFPAAKSHVICNSLVSKSVDNVIRKTKHFLKFVALHKDRPRPSG